MKKPVIYLAALLLILNACSNSAGDISQSESKSMSSDESGFNATEKSENAVSSEQEIQRSQSRNYLTSFAANNAFSDSLHRFVRKASLSFTTKDLLSATVGIEDLVREQKGYIEHSGMQNEVVSSENIAISNSEELIVSTIRPGAQLNVRVPVGELDKFLRSLHPFVKVLHFRNVETENIAFETLLSRLERIRIKKHSERAGSAKGSADVQGLDMLLEREMQSDKNLVNELQTEERVQYAAVSLTIKGTEYLVKERLPIFDNDDYEPSFWSKAGTSLSNGWKMLVGIVLALVSIWPVLLALGGIWWGVRRYWKKNETR